MILRQPTADGLTTHLDSLGWLIPRYFELDLGIENSLHQLAGRQVGKFFRSIVNTETRLHTESGLPECGFIQPGGESAKSTPSIRWQAPVSWSMSFTATALVGEKPIAGVFSAD